MNEKPQIVLFHSALGLRPAVREWAQRLEALGHRVHTPDLYDGKTFDDLEAGTATSETMGIPVLMQRTLDALDGLPARLIYMGFSLGSAAALQGALNRGGALGVVLMHGALPVNGFGHDRWPHGLPLEVHYAANDRFVDPALVETLRSQAQAAGAEVAVYTYPGSGHLFADSGLDDYDAAAAEQMWRRVSAFVGRVAAAENTVIDGNEGPR